MASDSHLFKTQQDLLNEGFELRSNIFQRKNEQFFPLYEGKMMWYYNSRFSSFEGIRTQDTRNTILTEYQNPNWEPMARYWVNETVFLKHKPQNNCLIGFRDITNVTNERTCVMSLLPNMPVGHTLPIILFEDYSHKKALYFVSLFSSMVFDYIVRQKVGGTHLSFHIVKQLPVLSPNSFTNPIDEIVMSLGIQLTYTSYSLQAFAQDILEEVGEETWQRWFRDASIHTSPPPEGQPAHPAPFVWDEERRAVLRAQLDAVYFHLYGLSREETDYILETFPIVKRKDEKKFGEYRTKRMILEFYDEYEEMMKEYKEKQGEKHAL